MVEIVFAADLAPGCGWKGNAYLSKYETDDDIFVLLLCCEDISPEKKNSIYLFI